MRYAKPTKPSELPELRAQLLDDDWVWEAVDVLSVLHSDFPPARPIRDSVRDASLWWVGTDCCDLLEQAAPSMPPIDLTVDLVPDLDGLAWLERPLLGSHGQIPGVEVAFDFVHWLPSFVEGLAAVSIIMWRLFPDHPELAPAPLGRSDWPYGWKTDRRADTVSELQHQSIVEDRRLLAALWQLSTQPKSTETTQVTADRAARRRMARRGHEPAPVRLVNLNRRRHRGATTATPGSREYTCQWIVRSHWRQQAYGPGRSLRKAVLIDQHIRGPEGMPLRVRDTVKVWDR
jgi:hypothetical protein